MEIVLVGLNHRTAPVEVREKVSFTAEQAQRACEELRARGILEETLVLSTCNRSEVYGVPPETELGTRPMSVASAGVKMAERIFGKLNGHRALVVGAGTLSEQVVADLGDRGVGQLSVMNRPRDRAEDLAKQYDGRVTEWGAWDTALQSPDVVVSSVSAEEPVLRRDVVERAMAARGNRALFLMDLGVPRNIAPDVAELY